MITACIITKNEASWLEECLKNISKYPFEIVVADTGSEDDSVEVAKRYADRVCRFEWCKDFSAARNYVASQASNDIVLMVDTDEMLNKADYDHIEVCPDRVGTIEIVNIYTRNGETQIIKEQIPRLYDRTKFHWEGCIHEQLVRKDGGKLKRYPVPLSFEHRGYDGTQGDVDKKADRNIELLLKEYHKNPEDVYILYQLGKSYYMKQDYEEAYNYFDKATYLEVDERLEYVADLIVSYGYSMINTKRNEKALALENLWDIFGKRAEYVFMMGLVYMNNLMFDKAVDTFVAATKIPDSNTLGVNSYLAWYNAGVIRECLGDRDGAVVYYRKCKDYPKAKQRLKEL